MIISSEIENVEKVENLIKTGGKSEKSILRAFARTRAKNLFVCFSYTVPLVASRVRPKTSHCHVFPTIPGNQFPLFPLHRILLAVSCGKIIIAEILL